MNGKALKPEDRNGHRPARRKGDRGAKSLEEELEADQMIDGGLLEEDALGLELEEEGCTCELCLEMDDEDCACETCRGKNDEGETELDKLE